MSINKASYLKVEKRCGRRKGGSVHPLGQFPSYEKCVAFLQRRSCYCPAPQLGTDSFGTHHCTIRHIMTRGNMKCPSMKHGTRAAVALGYPRPGEQLSTGVLPSLFSQEPEPPCPPAWVRPCRAASSQGDGLGAISAWRAASPKAGSQVNVL